MIERYQILVTVERNSEDDNVVIFTDKSEIETDDCQVIASMFLHLAGKNCKEGWDAAIDAVLRDAMKMHSRANS